MSEPIALFEVDAPPPPPKDTRSPGERRRATHLAAIQLGQHPLSIALHISIRLHPDARRDDDRLTPGTPRCGNCRLRKLVATNGNRPWPKCLAGAHQSSRGLYPGEKPTDRHVVDGRVPITEHPRVTHGAGTDLASWWPGCIDYEKG